VGDLGGFERRRGVPLDPACLHTEPEERAEILQPFGGRQRRVFPGASELAQPLHGQIPQMAMPAMRAEGEELAFEEFSALLDRRGREIADGGLGQELINGLGHGRQVGLEDADPAGRLPLMHDGGGGGPVAGVEAAADGFPADRALHPDRALAPGPAIALVEVLAAGAPYLSPPNTLENQAYFRHAGSRPTHYRAPLTPYQLKRRPAGVQGMRSPEVRPAGVRRCDHLAVPYGGSDTPSILQISPVSVTT
jgi:hypothetical protein